MTPPDCCTASCAGSPCGDCPGNVETNPLEPSPVTFPRGHVTKAICGVCRKTEADKPAPDCWNCNGLGETFETD